jgi:hypothetical protein
VQPGRLPTTDRRVALLATLTLLAMTACWGSTFFLIHDLLDRVPAVDFLAIRFAIASAAMLLDIGLGLREAATMLNDALETALRSGCWTADLGGAARCSEFGARVREALASRLTGREAHLELIAMNRGCCG